MGAQTAKLLDAEQDRQQRAAELSAEQGPDWAESYKPGSFGCHELLDRTALAANMVEEYVLSHPACVQDREWFALAEQAAAALRELYQRIGTDHMDETDGPPDAQYGKESVVD
jgi:hypothetical protein